MRWRFILGACGLLAIAAMVAAAIDVHARRARYTTPESEAERWRAELASSANLHLAIYNECSSVTDLFESSASRYEDLHSHDPWGQPFQVLCDGDEVHVWSAGRDGIMETGDDVGSPPEWWSQK